MTAPQPPSPVSGASAHDNGGHAPGCSKPEPEGGYGLAGGGIGAYMYCPECDHILSKVEDHGW
jgi:hypothetical protein